MRASVLGLIVTTLAACSGGSSGGRHAGAGGGAGGIGGDGAGSGGTGGVGGDGAGGRSGGGSGGVSGGSGGIGGGGGTGGTGGIGGGGGGGGTGGISGGGGGGGIGGIGGGGGIKPDWVNGSRIRARVRTTPDGARALLGWYDAQLKVTCSFVFASDGKTRCLPDYAARPHLGQDYYSDSACTNKISLAAVLGSDQCAAPTYAIEQDLTSVSCMPDDYQTAQRLLSGDLVYPKLIVHRVVSKQDSPYYVLGADGCSQPISPGQNLYQFDPSEVPPATFVEGGEEIE